MQRLQIDPGSWTELNRLLDEALDLPSEQRARWLEQLECGDRALTDRLRVLLSNAQGVETSDFLAVLPALQLSEAELAAQRASAGQAGDSVGPYRLLRQLGSGGMGSVWLAERTDGLIPRPVALKLPHGVRSRAGFAERMAREREILAALAHPNIARLYDAGIASDGQPYLALEFVEGRPLDEYCATSALDLRSRLLLFLQVARAVAYAHAKLVVHRDLKPANILVTADGQARLLDFGIAKLLDDSRGGDARRTEFPGLALTPDYASPEQIAGEPITTASDVYSLGVLLYELLTGARPYQLKRDSRGALEDAILQVDPRRPSDVVGEPQARRRLRGDVDTIVLKALKKTPGERYATVNALVEDLERYLADLPVLAQPDSHLYRYAKFLRRNKLAVVASSAVLAAILAGAAVAFWQARVALTEQRRAQEVKEFLASMFRDADPYRGSGQSVSAADLLRQARQRIDTLHARPELRVELLTLIGSSLLNLEDLDSAEQAGSQALTEAVRDLGPHDLLTLRARELMIGVHRFRGRTDAMRKELQALEEGLAARGDASTADRVLVLESRGHLSIDDGKADEAVAAGKQALDLASRNFGERDERTASAATLLAEAYEYSDATPESALEAAERAFRMTAALHGENSRHPRMIIARDVYGRALCRAGQMPEGVQQLEHAMRDAIAVFGPASSTAGFLAENLARYQRQMGDIRPALANLDRALEIHARYADRGSFTYLSPLTARGIAWLAARRGEEALKDLTESSRGLRQLFGPDHEETVIAEFHRALALAYTGHASEAQAAFKPVLQQYRTQYRDPVYLPSRALVAAGTALRLAGDPSAALAQHEEALASLGSNPSERQRAPVLIELGLDQLDLGAPQKAATLLEEARAIQAKKPQGLVPARVDLLVGLGRAHLSMGKAQSALEPLQQADAFWREFDGGNRWAGEAALWLGRCQLTLGRAGEARANLARAREILSHSPLPSDGKLLKLTET